MTNAEKLRFMYDYARENGLCKTQKEFAGIVGVTPNNMSNALSEKLYEKFCTNSFLIRVNEAINRPFSTDWLLTGEGAMLREDAAQADTASTRKRIPLYNDVASIGGLNGRVADVENASAQVAEWIDAGDWFPEATAAIRHYGDSMVEYPAGSILVLKRVQDMRLLLNGRNYVIETTEFRITKQLQYDAGNDYLTAYSTNRETYPDGRLVHSPIRIPLETIRHIDLIVGCVQKEFSNGAIPII